MNEMDIKERLEEGLLLLLWGLKHEPSLSISQRSKLIRLANRIVKITGYYVEELEGKMAPYG